MQKASTSVQSVSDRLARVALLIGGAALIALALVEAWQVFARYVLNDSPGWTEPVALLLLNTAMSLGAAAAVQQRAHFGFVVLAHAAPLALRRFLERFSLLVVASLGGVLAAGGVALLADGWSVAQAGTQLPQSVGYAPMSLAGALMAGFALQQLIATFRTPAAPTVN
ncbi:MAG: TRAP transporter small permease [Tahibacter sp.]